MTTEQRTELIEALSKLAFDIVALLDDYVRLNEERPMARSDVQELIDGVAAVERANRAAGGAA